MKKLMKDNLKITIKIGITLFLLLCFILLIILKNNQGICEAWTKGFARAYQYTFVYIFKYIPFSLMEWVVIAIVIVALIFLVLSIVKLCKKKFKNSIASFVNVCLIVISVLTIYQATAEMAYNREPIPIDLYQEKVEKTEFRKINEYFISDMNYCASQLDIKENGELISPYSLSDMNKKMEKEYERLTNPYFTNVTTYAKPMAFSFLFTEFHITGVTFMPTTEANINYMTPDGEKPFVLCHEIGHTKGVMREEDADLLSAYLLLSSEDPYFRYSGYCWTVGSLLFLGQYTGVDSDYNEILSMINPIIRKNWTFNSDFWKSHQSLKNFANAINDWYLKSSGQSKGTDSYNDDEPVIDPTKKEIKSFSTFQKLYFQLYYY